jgi:hypothetical protein
MDYYAILGLSRGDSGVDTYQPDSDTPIERIHFGNRIVRMLNCESLNSEHNTKTRTEYQHLCYSNSVFTSRILSQILRAFAVRR